jgi:hypothetical protein
MAEKRLVVIIRGDHRFAFRYTRGSEGTLLAALLTATRDRDNPLEWRDMLPVLVRLRDYILSNSTKPVVIRRET